MARTPKPTTKQENEYHDLDQMGRPAPAPTKVKEPDEILEQARKRANRAYDGWKENLQDSRAELDMNLGNQWPAGILTERTKLNRPSLTLNTFPAFCDQVLGDLRQSRPAIIVTPADGEEREFNTLDPDGRTLSQAEVFAGLIREIEYESQADAHYDTAVQHAVESGFGFLRVMTEWRDNDSFDQDIRIKCVRNRYAPLIDPDAQEFDASDANFAFIPEVIQKEDFDEKYPDAAPGSFAGDAGEWWSNREGIVVTEYFWREPVQETISLLSNGKVIRKAELEESFKQLSEAGITISRQRKVTTYKVMWCRCTSNTILEGPLPWPGSTIPVIPVYGKHFDLEEGAIYRGLTRYAADAKRMHNYWMTSATERVALAPKAPYLATPEMIEGHENEWKQLNTANYPYLLYNDPDLTGQRPMRDPPPAMPAAELQVGLQMKDETKSVIGIYDAGLGARSNETSGKAIMARQRESDTANFTFADNLNRSIRRVGIILTEIIPKIYDTPQTIRVRNIDDSVTRVEINKITVDGTGEPVLVNDLSEGRFNVRIKAGPSYTTQREQATEAMTEVLRADGSMISLIGDAWFNAMDWPGASEIAKRLRSQLPRHLLSAKEQEEMPPPEPTPEQQAEMAAAEAKKAEAEARKAEAAARLAEVQASMQGAQSDQAALIEDAVARGLASILAMMQGGGGPQMPNGADQEGGQ